MRALRSTARRRAQVSSSARFGGGVREPHRHDYHELIWVREGRGRHLLDGRPFPVRPHTITVIGRGQVHVFERGEDLHGAVVRFREEGLVEAGARRGTPEWLLAGQGGRTVVVPHSEAPRLDALSTPCTPSSSARPTSTAPTSSATCSR